MATGFIVTFNNKEKDEHVIITNKHVFEDLKTEIKIHFNLLKNGNLINFPRYICALNLISSDIINHPTMDLCGVYLNPYLNYIQQSLNAKTDDSDVYNIYYKCVEESMFVNNEVHPIQDILVVGYPLNQYDKFNYTPMYRKGITASDPNLNYNNSPHFPIDCACFPGSSGSPVFIYSGEYNGKLLGILYETPYIRDHIESLVSTDEDRNNIYNYTRGNLGFVIKSNQLLIIKSILFKRNTMSE